MIKKSLVFFTFLIGCSFVQANQPEFNNMYSHVNHAKIKNMAIQRLKFHYGNGGIALFLRPKKSLLGAIETMYAERANHFLHDVTPCLIIPFNTTCLTVSVGKSSYFGVIV